MEETKRFDARPILYAGVLAIVLMLALSLWAWPEIPDGHNIPIHWGLSGHPDGYAPKYVGLLLLPAVLVLLDLVLYWQLSLAQFKDSLTQSRFAILAPFYGCQIFIAFLHGLIVLAALGYNPPVCQLIAAAVGVLLIFIGALLAAGKIPRNKVVGVRTPWALADDKSWYKANRFGGWILCGMGSLSIISALCSNMLMLIVIVLTGTLLLVGGSWVYLRLAKPD